MSLSTVQQLEQFGPDRCDPMTLDQARDWCRRTVHRRAENFSVLSTLVPHTLRDDFAAVYAFCRWADDLGDEIADRDRALQLLGWWRGELQACFAGERPRHPVFIALAPTVRARELPIKPFDDLISAFEQDQSVTRYQTWDQLIDYCSRSADPVGRLVLMMCGEPRDDSLFALSDRICTALQLTNHWQDVARDIIERDRVYIPRELNPIERFDERLAQSARQGYGVDREFLGETRTVIRACVERTWPLFEQGAALIDRLQPSTRPLVWLFAAGGQHVLRQIELWNYETALHRPRLGRIRKAMLVAHAWWMFRRGAARAAKSSATSSRKVVTA